MIYFTTKAYNAEATLHRAVESVLCQTYGDFRYHLCDNGSTDGTAEIVHAYAALDKRIKPFFNVRNMEWFPESEMSVHNLARHLEDNDWLCVLDADDDYKENFLEEMLHFVQSYELDYAACRSDFIDETSGKKQNEYELIHDIIVEGEAFGKLFPDYFRFMGARWGKLQKGSMLKRVNFTKLDEYLKQLALSHRSDTVTMLWYLRHSARAGVLSKLLHNYRLYPKSHSTQNHAKKIQDNYKMPEVYREFLQAKIGFVSEENERFIGETFDRSMYRMGLGKGIM